MNLVIFTSIRGDTVYFTLSQSYTIEVRQLLMDYFDRKLQAELEEVTARKSYTEDDYRKMLRDDKYATQ